jgi:hypothetical protein
MFNTFSKGMIVTWGEGNITGEVVRLNPSDETVSIVLAKDFVGSCGKTFPKGTASRIPATELRAVH